MCRQWTSALIQQAGRLLRREDGPSATEYAILLAVLILGAMAVIQAIGQSMYIIYQNVNDAVTNAGIG